MCRFVKLHVEFPINVIRIEAPQKAKCYRFDIAVCDMCLSHMYSQVISHDYMPHLDCV